VCAPVPHLNSRYHNLTKRRDVGPYMPVRVIMYCGRATSVGDEDNNEDGLDCPHRHSPQTPPPANPLSPLDLQNFVGKTVYVGHDTNAASGWFIGHVHSCALSAADLRKTPSANFVIKYKSKETDKALNGLEARELSARKHGPSAWWVQLEKV
jgi:hypothetical protein